MSFEEHFPTDTSDPIEKKSLDFSKLDPDGKLKPPEIKIIRDAYKKNRAALLHATRIQLLEEWGLGDFIRSDYGAANFETLGGMEGIKALQEMLNAQIHWSHIKVDGYFGPITFRALIEYQRLNKLTTDAIAGPKTKEKIGLSSPISKWQKIPEKRVPLIAPKIPDIAPSIQRFSYQVASIENQLATITEDRNNNTGVVGGIGDEIGNSIRFFGGAGYETGKNIYEKQMHETRVLSKNLRREIVMEFEEKNPSSWEKKEITALISRLEKISGVKLPDISWGKAVANSIGVNQNTESNFWSRFLRSTIGMVEGAYNSISCIAEIAGKAIGTLWAYTFEPDARTIIEEDILDIFSQLTLENAEKALALIPDALTQFSNLPLDNQADGFGIFFGNLLVGAGIGIRLVQGGRHAVKLGHRAVRMATHQWLSKALPLAAAGATQWVIWIAAIGGGSVLRVGEMDVVPGKKWIKTLPKAKGISPIASKVSKAPVHFADTPLARNTAKEDMEHFDKIFKKEKGASQLTYSEEWRGSMNVRAAEKNIPPVAKATLKHPPETAKHGKKRPSWNETTRIPKESRAEQSEKHVVNGDSGIPFNPPKNFTTSWLTIKDVYRKMSMYYHADRNSHQDAGVIFKEMKRLYEAGKGEELKSIAENPQKYLTSIEKTLSRSPDAFMKNLQTYKNTFSESLLRNLARSDAKKFGEALLRKHILEEIVLFAKVDAAGAMGEFDHFLVDPERYLKKHYPPPHFSADLEAAGLAVDAYESTYKDEWKNLSRKGK